MAVAWRHAKLRLNTSNRLNSWTLRQRIQTADSAEPNKSYHIPVETWHAAQPAFRAAALAREQRGFDSRHEHRQQLQQLRQWLGEEQPSKWIHAKRNAQSEMVELVDADEHSERVEVLRDLIHHRTGAMVPEYRDVDVRCRLVLQACPHLQYLELDIETQFHEEPSHEDTFALVPRLRSLTVENYGIFGDDPELRIDQPVDFERMLDSLPRLTILRCKDMYITISDLLDIASHSTLEELHIEAAGKQLGDAEWLGVELVFPMGENESTWLLEQAAARMVLNGEAVSDEAEEAEETRTSPNTSMADSDEEHHAPAWTRDDRQRVQAAMRRTQPTRRSCEVRLALADWLHSRLRRGGLHVDPPHPPAWLLRHYRRQVALLRSTLQQQLSELSAAATRLPVDSQASASSRLDRLQRLYDELWRRCFACKWHAIDLDCAASTLKSENEQLATLGPGHTTTRSMAPFRIARVMADSATHRVKLAEERKRVRQLVQQAEELSRTVEAEGQRASAEFKALMQQVWTENAAHQGRMLNNGWEPGIRSRNQ